MKNSVYVGGGFSQDQLIWVIPIICEKYRGTKINRIVFEELPNHNVLKNIMIKNYLKEYEVINQSDLELLKHKYIKYFYVFVVNFFKILNFIFFVNKHKILYQKNWFKSQFNHAFWDICLKNISDGKIEPSLKDRFYSILRCCYYLQLSKNLVRNGVKEVFLGHSVYQSRVMLAYFRLSRNVKIFTQAAFNIQRQELSKDVPWHYISKNKLSLIKKNINKSEVLKYFNRRKKGKGNYYDANFASLNSKQKIIHKSFNTIFLHVFRDSPFNVIDNKRIFLDYFEWFEKTLSIIKKSNEIWLVRLHPSHKRWGENQLKTIKTFFYKNLGRNKFKNIILCDQKISNNYLINRSNKIITFSGSVQVESACFGKKVITIMPNYRNLNINNTITPKNFQDYKKILLLNKNEYKKLSYLSKKQILISKYILFIRENIHYLKKDLNGFEILRKDSDKIKKKNFNLILKKINKNVLFLRKNARILNENNSHTITSKYIKLFLN